MLSSLGPIWQELAALFMSIIMTIGTTFGIFVPSDTTNPDKFFDNEVKNVIFTN